MPKPQLIVITPVRNEAWVLEAFLTHCSSWADHIIVADQHSTDGSREIAMRFPKVTLIDNPTDEMHQANARLLLFQAVDRIEGEKIVWAMDADEFLSDGFQHTTGWKTIMSSATGSIFCLRWQNLIGDYQHEESAEQAYSEWVYHFDANDSTATLYAEAEKRAIHESRLPCPSTATYTNIDDIRFVHLARLNVRRTRNKNDFYQVSTLDKLNRPVNGISIYRTYHTANHPQPTATAVRLTTSDGNDITSLVHIGDSGLHYVDEMIAILQRTGYRKFRWLSIWDNPDLRAAGIDYQPPLHIRIIHIYLKNTQRHIGSLPVRIIDKLLKKIV